MSELISDKDEKKTVSMPTTALSYALLFSNASVIFVGVIFILRSFFMTSEKDFVSLGYSPRLKSSSNPTSPRSHEQLDDSFPMSTSSMGVNPLNIQTNFGGNKTPPSSPRSPTTRPKSTSMDKIQGESFKRNKSLKLGEQSPRKKKMKKKKKKGGSSPKRTPSSETSNINI